MKKECKKCHEVKDIGMFDKVSKNGYRGTCRRCRNIINTGNFLNKEENRNKMKNYMNEYQKNIRKNNTEYVLYYKALYRIKIIIRNIRQNKNLNQEELLFKKSIEDKFTDNMAWTNYGNVWEIDHIISGLKMAKVGYTLEEINDLRNIRPYLIKENRKRCKQT